MEYPGILFEVNARVGVLFHVDVALNGSGLLIGLSACLASHSPCLPGIELLHSLLCINESSKVNDPRVPDLPH